MRHGQNVKSRRATDSRAPALPPYLGMLGVGAPQIRTSPGAEVSFVALGLMDPPPAQVLLKVDVERPQAAVVLNIPRGRLGWTLKTFYSLGKDRKRHL